MIKQTDKKTKPKLSITVTINGCLGTFAFRSLSRKLLLPHDFCRSLDSSKRTQNSWKSCDSVGIIITSNQRAIPTLAPRGTSASLQCKCAHYPSSVTSSHSSHPNATTISYKQFFFFLRVFFLTQCVHVCFLKRAIKCDHILFKDKENKK